MATSACLVSPTLAVRQVHKSNMASQKLKKGPIKEFSIDDAFDDTLDEVVVRVYGSTTTSVNAESPFRGRSRNLAHEAVQQHNIKVDKNTSAQNNASMHSHPVLLGIKTGILPDDTASKDSDSLIHESYQYSPSYFDPTRIWWKHPRVKENWKVVAAAFALVIIGLGLLITGVAVLLIPLGGVQGLVFLITGALCLIPGAYHIVYIYFAVKGKKGYDFYHLPLFN